MTPAPLSGSGSGSWWWRHVNETILGLVRKKNSDGKVRHVRAPSIQADWDRRERGPHFWREFDPHWERVFGWERMVSPLGAGGLIAAECVEVRDVAVLGLSGVTWGRAVGWRGG